MLSSIVIGYLSALVIGLSLGLIGGGGSILAVPVLAYLFSMNEKAATAYSLFIVGVASMAGAYQQNRSKYVDWRTALVFGLPALLGVWSVRHFLVPILPDQIVDLRGFVLTRRMLMFGLFSLLMLFAAYSMLNGKNLKGGSGNVKYNYPVILLEGLLVGAITGLVGAGGGFLIIPALVLLANLEIKIAIGTSLVIIAIKSLFGFFLGDALSMQVDWSFLIKFTSITLIGIFIGSFIGKRIDGKKLTKAFGYFILIMALFIFIMEFLVKQ